MEGAPEERLGHEARDRRRNRVRAREDDKKLDINMEHCIYSWTIENSRNYELSQAPWICSPPFWAGSCSLGTWTVKFQPLYVINGHKGIGMKLRRLEKSSGPETVFVTFRFGISNPSGNRVWFQELKKVPFMKSASKLQRTTVLGDLEDFLNDCDNDTFTVLCEMYVSSVKNKTDKRPDLSTFDDLEHLSEDLTSVFDKKPHRPRMLLRASNKSYNVHNCILAARSTIFCRMLSDGSLYLEYPDINHRIMSTLLFYLYSGNFSLSLLKNHLAIGLYECAKRLDICGLDAFLVPNLVFAKTSAYVEECRFNWTIENFMGGELEVGRRISSPKFSTNAENGYKWTIIVYPRGTESVPDHVGIVVKPSSHGIGAIFTFVEISLLDRNDKLRHTKRGKIFLVPGASCKFPTFIKTDDLISDSNDLLHNGNLMIVCKLMVLATRNVTESSMVAFTYNGQRTHLEKLSRDMQTLYERPALKDFEFEFGERTLRAHMAILLARSTIVSSLRVRERRMLNVSEMDFALFQKMLSYLYTGKLGRVSYQEAMELLRMAREYQIRPLKMKCRQILKSCLSVSTVFPVIWFADENKEIALKRDCLLFISSHSQESFSHPSWKRIKQLKSDLAKEISEFQVEQTGRPLRTVFSCRVREYANEILLFAFLTASIFMLRKASKLE